MSKLRVGVLMGGKSVEREVSFNSGRTVCDHLDTATYDVIPIFQTHTGALYHLPWHFLHRGKIADFIHRLEKEATQLTWSSLSNHVDFVYIAVHGQYAEDGILQGTLEVLGIPYLGSDIFSSALCMDKARVKSFLDKANIHTPKHVQVMPHELEQFEKNEKEIHAALEKNTITFPCIVKPCYEGSSIGISLVQHESELHNALQIACSVQKNKPQPALIEELIPGMEFSCIVLVDNTTNEYMPLPPTEIVREANSDFFDYDQKYMPGRAHKFTPARCDAAILKKIQTTCTQVMQTLNIKTIARIDGFVTPDNIISIIDCNTSSGMAPSSFVFREAAEVGLSHTGLINHLIETDLKAYNMKTIESETDIKKTAPKKMRVGVLLGGASHEREISLESGRNITYKLSPHQYDVTPIFVDTALNLYRINQAQLVRNTTKEIALIVDEENKLAWDDLADQFDFIFIGLHGGLGENGGVQGMLEMIDLPYNGSGVLASSLCIDKYKTAQYLRALGFETPNGIVIEKESKEPLETSIETVLSTLSFPCIVKPHDDGCSVMVFKCHTKKELLHAITTIQDDKTSNVLIEEYVTGMELTVGVIGNETPHALPPSQAVTTNAILSIEEKFLPGAGENQTPAPLPSETLSLIQQTMERVYKAAGCKGYARIDCFYQTADQSPTNTERVIVLEINTLPGLTPATCIFHQAAEMGIKPMDFIDLIVQYGIAEHTKTTEPILSFPSKKSSQVRNLHEPDQNEL